MAVPADFADEVLRIYNEDFELPHIYHGAGAVVIGDITLEPNYTIETAGSVVCSAPVDVITTGISYNRKGKPRRRLFEEPKLDPEALAPRRFSRDDLARRTARRRTTSSAATTPRCRGAPCFARAKRTPRSSRRSPAA